MNCNRGRSQECRARGGKWRSLGSSLVRSGAVALVLAGAIPARVRSQQQATSSSPLVFDGVTVIDVERGKLLPAQRVIIVGNRIQTVGGVGAVKVPPNAQVVDAHGKYMIPGMWDMHIHAFRIQQHDGKLDIAALMYPLLLANGVTGIRDAGSRIPLDSLILWRREILAGSRLGPPRQLLSGMYLNDEYGNCKGDPLALCVTDSARARYLVDSLKAAGADMIKLRDLRREMYFAGAAEARRVGIPFGGHRRDVTAIEASDSGALIIDHLGDGGGLGGVCGYGQTDLQQCRVIA